MSRGKSCHKVLAQLDLAVATVVRWLARHRATGSLKPGQVGGHRPRKIVGEHRDWVLAQVANGADVTLQGLADGLAERGLTVDYRTMWNFMQREGKSLKKTICGDEQTRPDVARKRRWWGKYLLKIDITRMFFIDETWTRTNMAPLRGWGTKGKRHVARVPHGHWKTLTFLAALRCDSISAPCLFDGPINGESFLLYVQQFLVPTLRPGDVVVMDNLGSHKAEAVRQAIKKVRARLVFLPPYCPDLNPIKQFFSTLKHWLRKAKERTVEDLNNRIGAILKRFPQKYCENYFRNAGYGSV